MDTKEMNKRLKAAIEIFDKPAFAISEKGDFELKHLLFQLRIIMNHLEYLHDSENERIILYHDKGKIAKAKTSDELAGIVFEYETHALMEMLGIYH